jgi:transcriptional regulator with XRE-family HTH domain
MLRAESGWSTREFADHAGLSLSTLYGIEHGKLKSVRLASTARIAKAFGVDIGVLLSPMAKPRRPWLGEEPQVVIAAALVLTRKAKGWTQDRLSQQAGVQRDIVAKVERASRDSTLLVLEKLARALEVSLADLFQVSDSGTK